VRRQIAVIATRCLWIAVFCGGCAALAAAQELRFDSTALGKDTASAMSVLAERAIAIYKDDNRDRYLDNLFRLQIVAGRYAEATRTLTSLRALRRNRVSLSATAANALYAILASARERSADARFEQTFRQEFSDAFARLDDKTSALAIRALGVSHF